MNKLNNPLEILDKGHRYWKNIVTSGNVSEYNLLNNPNIGDLVFESGTPYKRKQGFGFLIAVDFNSGNPLYWIVDCLTESVIQYSNCEFKKIKGFDITEYSFYSKIEKDNNEKR